MHIITKRLIGSALLAYMIIGARSVAQIDTNAYSAGDDLTDLYQRAASSRYVITGKVVSSEGISRRIPADLITTTKSLDEFVGGSLYTIRVERTLCDQQDFVVKTSSRPTEQPSEIHIFVPRDEPLFIDGHRREEIVEGEKYLLFLIMSPQQKQWKTMFRLPVEWTYYRGEERARGIVPISEPSANNPAPREPPLLEKVTKLCQAMEPQKASDKAGLLRQLLDSGDPVLASAATAALKELNASSGNPKQ